MSSEEPMSSTTTPAACGRCCSRTDGPARSAFAGTRSIECAECGHRTNLGLTRGWRAFWWVLALLTAVGVVTANATLRDDYSWIPAGIGLVSFVVLAADIVVRRRAAHRAQDAIARGWDAEGLQRREPSAAGTVALTIVVGAALLASIGGALVVTGLNNGYTHEVVVQEAEPASSDVVYTSASNLVMTGTRICGGGEDFFSCVEVHRGMFNSVCIGTSLTLSAESTCASLRTWLDDAIAQLPCGGCTTLAGTGGWGWNYLRPVPATSWQTVPGRSAITYEARCDFDLGPIEFGDCPGRPD